VSNEGHRFGPDHGLAATLAGFAVGSIVGAIVAVNIVIYAGPDSGYQSSIGDVFRHSAPVGVLAVAALVAGPVLGVMIARRSARN